MTRNLRWAFFLLLGAALLPTGAFAKSDHDQHNDRVRVAEKIKNEKHAERHDDARWRDWDHDRDVRWHREQDRERERIAREREHERVQREGRERREEQLRREREWARQREWERKHGPLTAQRGPSHMPAGWTDGKKTAWKGCDVPPGQAKPAGCGAAPVQPVAPQSRIRVPENGKGR